MQPTTDCLVCESCKTAESDKIELNSTETSQDVGSNQQKMFSSNFIWLSHFMLHVECKSLSHSHSRTRQEWLLAHSKLASEENPRILMIVIENAINNAIRVECQSQQSFASTHWRSSEENRGNQEMCHTFCASLCCLRSRECATSSLRETNF